MKNFVVTDTENGMRLLRLVQLLTFGMPKSILYKSFRTGRIKVFNKKQKENYRVKTGDVLSLYINDEFFTDTEKALNPSNGFKVVYHDEHLAILYKESGVLCHSDETGDGNLLDGFIKHYGSGTFRPCLINRLDRGTEGLVIIARTHNAAEQLNSYMRDGGITKLYLAVTDGKVDGLVKTGYSRKDRITVATDGDEMISEFETLKKKGNYYLLQIKLHTGKTHQIRSHLASLGVHIIGDRKYLKDSKDNVSNQLLCAYKICFSETAIPELSGVAGSCFTADNSRTVSYFDSLK